MSQDVATKLENQKSAAMPQKKLRQAREVHAAPHRETIAQPMVKSAQPKALETSFTQAAFNPVTLTRQTLAEATSLRTHSYEDAGNFYILGLPNFPDVERKIECALVADKENGTWRLTRFFRAAAEKTGWEKHSVEFPPGATPGKVLKALRQWSLRAWETFVRLDVAPLRPASLLVTPLTKIEMPVAGQPSTFPDYKNYHSPQNGNGFSAAARNHAPSSLTPAFSRPQKTRTRKQFCSYPWRRILPHKRLCPCHEIPRRVPA